MAFSNQSIVAPRKNKPHICLRDGWWRVSPLRKPWNHTLSDLWGAAHRYAHQQDPMRPKKENKVEHIFEKHTDCRLAPCDICDGGLSVCTECGQCEGDLEESCPSPKGSRAASEEEE